jgi:hypothetical protein
MFSIHNTAKKTVSENQKRLHGHAYLWDFICLPAEGTEKKIVSI